MLKYRLEHETDLVNIPPVDSEFSIGCDYNPDSNKYRVYQSYSDGRCRYSISELYATTPESLASDIASIVRKARMIGFQQGRQHVREALGIDK